MRPLASRRSAVAMVAAVAIAAAAASLMVAPGVRGVCGAGLALLAAAIGYRDARDLIIPDLLAGAAVALALVYAAVAEPAQAVAAMGLALLRLAVVSASFLAIKLGYRAVRGRDGLGMGDVKLAGVAGAWLDWLTVLVAVDLAVFAALGGYVLRQLSRARPLRRTGLLPFGLYLAPAIWVGWLLEMTLLAP